MIEGDIRCPWAIRRRQWRQLGLERACQHLSSLARQNYSLSGSSAVSLIKPVKTDRIEKRKKTYWLMTPHLRGKMIKIILCVLCLSRTRGRRGGVCTTPKPRHHTMLLFFSSSSVSISLFTVKLNFALDKRFAHWLMKSLRHNPFY